jgi:hypothetical protein
MAFTLAATVKSLRRCACGGAVRPENLDQSRCCSDQSGHRDHERRYEPDGGSSAIEKASARRRSRARRWLRPGLLHGHGDGGGWRLGGQGSCRRDGRSRKVRKFRYPGRCHFDRFGFLDGPRGCARSRRCRPGSLSGPSRRDQCKQDRGQRGHREPDDDPQTATSPIGRPGPLHANNHERTREIWRGVFENLRPQICRGEPALTGRRYGHRHRCHQFTRRQEPIEVAQRECLHRGASLYRPRFPRAGARRRCPSPTTPPKSEVRR